MKLNRRLVMSIAAIGLAGRVGALRAQTAGAAVPRIGLLSFGSAPAGANSDPIVDGLRQGLLEFGYVPGRSVVLEYRYAEGQFHRLALLAAELVRLKVDVIVSGGPAPLLAARKATGTIPIVTVSGGDPVGDGWAQSLARPGGNVTGLTVTFPELGAKRLELLSQALPGLARMAVLAAPADAHLNASLDGLHAGARALGAQLQVVEVGGPADFEPAFDSLRRGRAQGLYAISTNTVVSSRARLAELAIGHRLPMIGGFTLLAEAGFLMSYGAALDALARRAAGYVDRILKGARAGDLPVERPTEFELVLNRGTERALGITLPQAVLARANRLIE